MKKTLIYISHPYGGLAENKTEVEAMMRVLCSQKRYTKNYCFVSPIHNFGHLYEAMSYKKGLKLCIDLLANCKAMVVMGDWKNSEGCTAEMRYCRKHNIPVIEFKDFEDFLRKIMTENKEKEH